MFYCLRIIFMVGYSSGFKLIDLRIYEKETGLNRIKAEIKQKSIPEYNIGKRIYWN